MKNWTWIATVVTMACIVARPAAAQHEHQDSPYAGMEHGEIPSLTQQEMLDLRNAAGMGFAKPAELNHYPGPRHVIELKEAIGLTSDQLEAIEGIESVMRERALELGEAIIEAERALNQRFEHGHIDEETLEAATREIAAVYGELRYTHLQAHLTTRRLLTDAQVAEYDRLRGYETAMR